MRGQTPQKTTHQALMNSSTQKEYKSPGYDLLEAESESVVELSTQREDVQKYGVGLSGLSPSPSYSSVRHVPD